MRAMATIVVPENTSATPTPMSAPTRRGPGQESSERHAQDEQPDEQDQGVAQLGAEHGAHGGTDRVGRDLAGPDLRGRLLVRGRGLVGAVRRGSRHRDVPSLGAR
ncbi:hypothetical protein NKG05_21790 [Oerskovia sp. M15]